MNIYVFFNKGVSELDASEFADHQASGLLINSLSEYFDARYDNTDVQLAKDQSGAYVANISTVGIARHPAQLYESVACVILFILLWTLWWKYKEQLPQGLLFGIFLIWCFGLRFAFEYLKEVQVPFEKGMALNMGQILSIPLVLAGIIILALSLRKKAA